LIHPYNKKFSLRLFKWVIEIIVVKNLVFENLSFSLIRD
jgi:hypothetical protein